MEQQINKTCKCCGKEFPIDNFPMYRRKYITNRGVITRVYALSVSKRCHYNRMAESRKLKSDELKQYGKNYWKSYKRKPVGSPRTNAITELEKQQLLKDEIQRLKERKSTNLKNHEPDFAGN